MKKIRIKIYEGLCSHSMQSSVAPLRSIFIMPLYSGAESAPLIQWASSERKVLTLSCITRVAHFEVTDNMK